MQLSAGIPIDIISVLQALILAFIAAPAIIRTIYRLRQPYCRRGRPGSKRMGRLTRYGYHRFTTQG
jgi:general nucleoside transport system permease protein